MCIEVDEGQQTANASWILKSKQIHIFYGIFIMGLLQYYRS